jgi:Uma2 family endonuclease
VKDFTPEPFLAEFPPLMFGTVLAQWRCQSGKRVMQAVVSKRRFTVDDYHRMVEAGILSERERVELIDGEVVAMTPIGPRHNASVDRALRALVTSLGDEAIVRVQGSVRLDYYREPQPDLALLRPRADFYASALPGPADILLIVEIAESSLDYDRDLKARVYADAGVREYWLVDLSDNVLSCYAKPLGSAYQRVRTYHRGQVVAPELLPEHPLPVDVWLGE